MSNTENECKTLDVPTAGKRYLGLGQNASYIAAKKGYIPTIRIGWKLRVPIAAMERMLEAADKPRAEKDAA